MLKTLTTNPKNQWESHGPMPAQPTWVEVVFSQHSQYIVPAWLSCKTQFAAELNEVGPEHALSPASTPPTGPHSQHLLLPHLPAR